MTVANTVFEAVYPTVHSLGYEDTARDYLGQDRMVDAACANINECGPIKIWWENIAMRYNDGTIWGELTDD